MLSLDNRAFRYGDALFESIRVVQGRPCFLEAHLARLRHGSERLGLRHQEDLYALVAQLLHRSGTTSGRLRMCLTRKSGGLYAPQQQMGIVGAEISPVEPSTYPTWQHGLKVGRLANHRVGDTILNGLKSANALTYVMAGKACRELGWDEGLLTNHRGEIVEGYSSNLWVWKDGQLSTPSLQYGGVAGVIRQLLLESRYGWPLPVQARAIHPDELSTADEIWLTNAIQGIRWVADYEGRELTGQKAVEMQEKLREMALSSAKDLPGSWP